MPPNSPNKRSIQSDETLFDIIEYIHNEESAGVTEIAESLEFSKSTVHGHLTALQRRRYVVKEDDGYRLGMEFLNHGKQVQTSYDLYSIAHEKVTQLAKETGERAWCMVEENGRAYYLVGAEGDHPVHPPVRIGKGVHLHPRSAGKAILAHLEEKTVKHIINRYGLPAKTSNTITSQDELFQELERVREQGYAINDGESLAGLYAIGAPIIHTEETVRGALTISGPANRMKTDEKKEEIIELLLGATNELEINLLSEN
jgi:DNA-binding IclR family transcriptional regulator